MGFLEFIKRKKIQIMKNKIILFKDEVFYYFFSLLFKIKKFTKGLATKKIRINNYLRYLKNNGKINIKPDDVILMITKKCNLNCKFCNIKKEDKEMSLNDIKRIIRSIKRLGIKSIFLTGGEPLLNKAFDDIVLYLKNNDFYVGVSTNGVFIDKHINSLKKIDFVGISLDGSEDIHDKLRGKKGVHKRVLENIQLLKENNVKNIEIDFVVNNKNINDLEKVYNFTINEKIRFNFWPVNNSKELYLNDIGLKIYKNFAKRFKKNLTYHDNVENYIQDEINVRCWGLVSCFAIDVDGDILPCCVWNKNNVLGNIFKDDLLKLWTSKKAYDIRKNIFDFKCKENCYNVSFLNNFTKETGLPFYKEKSN